MSWISRFEGREESRDVAAPVLRNKLYNDSSFTLGITTFSSEAVTEATRQDPRLVEKGAPFLSQEASTSLISRI